MKAGTAKNVSSVLGFDLKMVFGRNSPVNSTTKVESSVSAVTRMPSLRPLNSSVSKMRAKRMP